MTDIHIISLNFNYSVITQIFFNLILKFPRIFLGYTNKYPVERCLRDIRLLRIGGGTEKIMKYLIQKRIYRKNKNLKID